MFFGVIVLRFIQIRELRENVYFTDKSNLIADTIFHYIIRINYTYY